MGPVYGGNTSLTNPNVSQERFLNEDRFLTPEGGNSGIRLHTQMANNSGIRNLNQSKEDIILSELSL
jgi:hypothetical protein